MIWGTLLGALFGGLIVFFFIRGKSVAALSAATEKARGLESQVSVLKDDVSLVRTAKDAELKEERQKKESLRGELATSQADNRNLQEKLAGQKEELEKLTQKFTTEFENLANKILTANSKTFAEQNKINLDTILNPLKTKLGEFKDQVEKSYKTESDERIALKEEIKQLAKLNQQVSDDANQLAVALKGDNKQQGCWGEMVLEKILESSGLREGEEFRREVSTTNAADETIRPDVVVSLPDDKHIIVDSKVSLVAYTNYVNEASEEERVEILKAHVASLRGHVKLLGEKHYPTAKGLNSPDFVLMFVPIESSFGLAFQGDVDLFNFAWGKKIIMVSPATLLAALQTIASFWKVERQTRNALEIAEEGGKLYDKFVGFCEDMKNIGIRLKQAGDAHGDAMNKLKDGSGNLIGKAEKMKALGAKATKQLPQELIDTATQ
jgi:DNA recombination protein RmuC